ncbi:MAG: SirB2 family protein [Gammaproteobacteria bacterium]|nr:SirB2 family protein [Gammaproteobacteria bacterium]
MLLYPDLKTLHVLFAAASLLLFVVRGGYTLLLARSLRARVWRWLPPVVDSLLLTFGIWLAVLLRINPLHADWLGVKLLCVIIYIAVGILAFRLHRPRWLKITLFAAAVLLFAFIASIAVWHDPRGIFVLSD